MISATPWGSRIQLAFLNLIWSFTAVLGVLIDLPAAEVVLFRTAIAAAGLGLLVRALRIPSAVKPRVRIAFLLTGCLIGAHWFLFFLAAKLANVSICLVALATTALMTSFLKPFVERGSRVHPSEIAFGLLVVAAIVLIFGFEGEYAGGFAAGLGSAFFAAAFNLANARLTPHHDHRVIAGWEMVGACLFSALLLPITSRWFSEGRGYDLRPDGSDLVWLVVLALVCTVYSFSAYVGLLRYLSAYTVALYSNLEPVFGIILGIVLFQEHRELGPGFFVGVALILGSILAYTWVEKRTTA